MYDLFSEVNEVAENYIVPHGCPQSSMTGTSIRNEGRIAPQAHHASLVGAH
jgi:hypothetical protein